MTRNRAEIMRELAQARDRVARDTAERDRRSKYLAEAKSHIARLEAELDARPEPVADLIKFTKQYGRPTGRGFDYAAIAFKHERTGARMWSVTGKVGLATVPWASVAHFIDLKETDKTKPQVLECGPSLASTLSAALGKAFTVKDEDINPFANRANSFGHRPYSYRGF